MRAGRRGALHRFRSPLPEGPPAGGASSQFRRCWRSRRSSATEATGTLVSRECADRPGEVRRLTTSQERVSGAVGRRYWIVVVVVIILGLSLLLSYDFASGHFSPSAWSNLISGVQVSTLVVVIAFFFWWTRSRHL